VGLSLDSVRSELDAALAGAEPGIDAANELCAACVGLLGIDGAAVSMVHDGSPWWTVGSSSETSRRLDEYQFTFGEGPCLDAVATREAVLVPDLDAPREQRWPAFSGAVLDDGIRGVFALPIVVTNACVGALDFFRVAPGPLQGVQLAGALMAAQLATQPLVTLLGDGRGTPDDRGAPDGMLEMDRIEVYQATGMLIAQLDVDADDALLRLRAHAIATGQTASQVAWAILERGLRLERDDDSGPGRSER
jgi:hypothetical protein